MMDFLPMGQWPLFYKFQWDNFKMNGTFLRNQQNVNVIVLKGVYVFRCRLESVYLVVFSIEIKKINLKGMRF